MNDLSASRWSPRMQTYYWVKTFHLVFVVAWMASVFYLPRILVNLSETAGQLPVVERLQLMGLRLYRFGHMMFGFALILGLVLWLGYKVIPDFPTMVAPGAAGWLHAKLGGVVLLLVYFSWTGRLLKSAVKGRALPSSRALRWFNELPLVLFVVVVWLVLAKPF